MEGSGSRKIIDPLQQAIACNSFAINSANIHENVSNFAQSQKRKLIDEPSFRLLMLKIDSATCKDGSVLCRNVQHADTQANESIAEEGESDVDTEPSDENQEEHVVEIDQRHVLQSVRCSPRMLQLAVEDEMKDKGGV